MKKLNDTSILVDDDDDVFKERKTALENEIQKRLVEQLAIRAQTNSNTPEQQALIEELYLDLKFINPELALNTLKAYASLKATGINLKSLNGKASTIATTRAHTPAKNLKSKSKKELNDKERDKTRTPCILRSKIQNGVNKRESIYSTCDRDITKTPATVCSNLKSKSKKDIHQTNNERETSKTPCPTSSLKSKSKKEIERHHLNKTPCIACNSKNKRDMNESIAKESSNKRDEVPITSIKDEVITGDVPDMTPTETLKILEVEIQKRLLSELLILKNQKQIITPEQIATIENLYRDLEFINPELAWNTLQMSRINPPDASSSNSSSNHSNNKTSTLSFKKNGSLNRNSFALNSSCPTTITTTNNVNTCNHFHVCNTHLNNNLNNTMQRVPSEEIRLTSINKPHRTRI